MEVENKSVTISMNSLWKVFSKRFIILLIVGILCFAALFLYSKLTYVPQYQSTGEMYMLLQHESGDRDGGDYQISTLIAGDAARILQSRHVRESVKADQDLKLDWTVEELARRMTVTVEQTSGFLKVTVTGDSPEQAQAIANAVCRIGASELNKIWGENQANVLGQASLPKGASNTPSILMMAIVSVGITALLYAIFLILFLKNEHIGNGEDVERRLQVAILGEIPDANKSKHYGPMRYLHKYGKYGKYSKYSKYGAYSYGYTRETPQKNKKPLEKGGSSDQ